MKPSWTNSGKTHILLFNVGRGLSMFLRTPWNHGFLYDLGASEEFSPTTFLKAHIMPYITPFNPPGSKSSSRLAQRIISHPHLDHICEVKTILNDTKSKKPVFSCGLHTCPHDKGDGTEKPEKIDWSRVNNPEDASDELEAYKSIYDGRSLPLQTILYEENRSLVRVEYGIYYYRPPQVAKVFPSDDQEYSNGCSIVFYWRNDKNVLLVPGDVNPEIMKRILSEGPGLEKRFTRFAAGFSRTHPIWHSKSADQPALKLLLGNEGLSVLVAPHHGLESGYSQDLYDAIRDKKPEIVLISERRHTRKTDGKTHPNYQKREGAKGLPVRINGRNDHRYSVKTTEGHILVTFAGNCSPSVFVDKDPEKLLGFM